MSGYLDEILGYQQQSQISGRGKLRPDQVEAAFQGDIGAREKSAQDSRSIALQERQVATGEKSEADTAAYNTASLAQQGSQFQQTLSQTQTTQQGQQQGQATQSLIAAGGVLAGMFNAWNKPADKTADKTADSFNQHFTQIDKELNTLKEQLGGQESALATILNDKKTGGALGSDEVIQTSKTLAPFTEKAPTLSEQSWSDWTRDNAGLWNGFAFAQGGNGPMNYTRPAYDAYRQQTENAYTAAYQTYEQDVNAYNNTYNQFLTSEYGSGAATGQYITSTPELTPAYMGAESGGEYTGNEGSGSSGGEE